MGPALLPTSPRCSSERADDPQGRRGRLPSGRSLVNVGDGDFILRAKRVPDGELARRPSHPQYSTSGAEVVPRPRDWSGVAMVTATGTSASRDQPTVPTGRRPDAVSKSRVDSKVGFCYYDFRRHGIKVLQTRTTFPRPADTRTTFTSGWACRRDGTTSTRSSSRPDH